MTSPVGSLLISKIKRKISLREAEEEITAKILDTIAKERSIDEAHNAVVRQGKPIGYTDLRYAHLSDMFRSEKVDTGVRLDLAKVQLFFFTLIVVMAYAAAPSNMFLVVPEIGITTFPAIDSSMVAFLGIGHAVFLVGSTA